MEQTIKELKKMYNSPTLSEIGKIQDKTKGNAIDGVHLDSCTYEPCGYES